MIVSKQLQRVYKIGTMEIVDQNTDLSLDDSVRILAKTYPQFRQCRLYPEDGVPNGDNLVFTLKVPPAKSNG